MRVSVAGVLLGLAAAGFAIVWFGREQIGQAPAERTVAKDHVGGMATSSILETTLDRRSVKQNAANDDDVTAQADNPSAASSSVGMTVERQTPPDGEARTRSDVRALTFADNKPSGPDVKKTNGADQKTLQQQTRITCEFETGYNNGFVWEGKLTSGSAAWQGGPLIYDAIDGEAGTAQLLGGEGVTHSTDGHADARVAIGSNRVEFLSTLANGSVLFTTVFNERDEQGRLIAVMSRHEGLSGTDAYGSQFLGRCR